MSITNGIPILAAIIMLQAPVTMPQASQMCTITVVDMVGAVIPGVHVIVHHDAFGRPENPDDLIFTTDVNGVTTFSLIDGFYDVCVMSPAFTPDCRKMQIQGKAVQAKFRMRISPEVTKALGDRFE